MKHLLKKSNSTLFIENNYKLHAVCKNWIKELEFISKEQVFFREMLVNYVMDQCRADCYKKAKLLLNSIDNEKELLKKLLSDIEEHKINLSLLIEKIYMKRADYFREQHSLLKKDMTNYLENYRYLKEQLFSLILYVLKLKKENIQC